MINSDGLQLFGVLLGIENLMENRQQTADNDVQKANDKQANYLISELSKQFEKQNKMLEEQNKMLNEIIRKVDGLKRGGK